jgi:hypothetical protein
MARKLHLAVDKVVPRQEGGQEEEFRPEDLNIMLAFQVGGDTSCWTLKTRAIWKQGRKTDVEELVSPQ